MLGVTIYADALLSQMISTFLFLPQRRCPSSFSRASAGKRPAASLISVSSVRFVCSQNIYISDSLPFMAASGTKMKI
jgi:hypothetical protein